MFSMPNFQGRYWLLTIPQHEFTPFLPVSCNYIKGQLEQGNDTGYLHWQVFVCFAKKVRLQSVKETFGTGIHCELTRSAAANEYVWKEETYVEGTKFELGKLPLNRNSKVDWDRVREMAKSGELDQIPPDIFIRCYSQLVRIRVDYCVPTAIERTTTVYYGPTGVGKSRRCWEQAGDLAYPKDPRSKFWDGYRGQENVIIDEFRGGIDISHMLRWLDRYPVIVEIKGSSTVLKTKKFWITSNLSPREWYPDIDEETMKALLRRMEVIHCPINLYS